MGVLYMPFFNAADTGAGTIVLSTAGKSDVSLNLATVTSADYNSAQSSIFSQYLCTAIKSFDSEQTVRFPHYARSSWTVAVESALRALMTTATWSTPSNFNCDFSYTTGLITFSYSATFGVDWQGSQMSALMFGFSPGLVTPTNLSGASTYTGTLAPYYCINCALSDVSDETGLFEPDGLGNHVIDDTGGGNSLARTQAPQFNEWRQEYESYVNTYSEIAQLILSSPFPHKALFAHCRKGFPFVLYGANRWDSNAQIYSLRSDGMSFTPIRASRGNGGQFHIPYRCHLEGVAT